MRGVKFGGHSCRKRLPRSVSFQDLAGESDDEHDDLDHLHSFKTPLAANRAMRGAKYGGRSSRKRLSFPVYSHLDLGNSGSDLDEDSHDDYHMRRVQRRRKTVFQGFSLWPTAKLDNILNPKELDAGEETVQDCLKTLEYLMERAITSALLSAGLDFRLVMAGIDADKARPVVGTNTKASLEKVADQIVTQMKGSGLFSAKSKQSVADRVKMAPTLMLDVHTFLVATATFSCSFSSEAAAAWKKNAVPLNNEKRALQTLINHRPDAMVVADATDLLEKLQKTLELKVEEAMELTHCKQEAALTILRATEGRQLPKVLGSENAYEAKNQFRKKLNSYQDDAAKAEKKRQLLDSLAATAPGSGDRASLISRGVCKWHYGGQRCNRGPECLFSHVSRQELDGINVTEEEVKAAFPPPRRA